MDTLVQSAKRADTLLRILFWLVIAGVLLASALFAAALLCGPQSALYREVIACIELGGVQITPAAAAVSPGGALQTAVLWRVVAMLVGAAAVCAGIRLVRSILRPVILRTPFAPDVSRRVRRLALYSLAAGAAVSACRAIGRVAAFNALDAGALLARERIERIIVGLDFDPGFLVTSIVLFLLSLLFRYGEELQKLSDETL